MGRRISEGFVGGKKKKAPTTKAAAKVNVCPPARRRRCLCSYSRGREGSDVVVGGRGGGAGPLRLHTQALNYVLVHEHVGGSVCINTAASTTAAFAPTLEAHRGSAGASANKIDSVSVKDS